MYIQKGRCVQWDPRVQKCVVEDFAGKVMIDPTAEALPLRRISPLAAGSCCSGSWFGNNLCRFGRRSRARGSAAPSAPNCPYHRPPLSRCPAVSYPSQCSVGHARVCTKKNHASASALWRYMHTKPHSLCGQRESGTITTGLGMARHAHGS